MDRSIERRVERLEEKAEEVLAEQERPLAQLREEDADFVDDIRARLDEAHRMAEETGSRFVMPDNVSTAEYDRYWRLLAWQVWPETSTYPD